jgi:hypothetical protein
LQGKGDTIIFGKIKLGGGKHKNDEFSLIYFSAGLQNMLIVGYLKRTALLLLLRPEDGGCSTAGVGIGDNDMTTRQRQQRHDHPSHHIIIVIISQPTSSLGHCPQHSLSSCNLRC